MRSSYIGRIDIDKRSLAVNMFVFAFGFDLDAALPSYLRYEKLTERLHRHRDKVKSSSLSALTTKNCI